MDDLVTIRAKLLALEHAKEQEGISRDKTTNELQEVKLGLRRVETLVEGIDDKIAELRGTSPAVVADRVERLQSENRELTSRVHTLEAKQSTRSTKENVATGGGIAGAGAAIYTLLEMLLQRGGG